MNEQKKLFFIIVLLFSEKLWAETTTQKVEIPAEKTKLVVYFNNNHEIKNCQDQYANSDSVSSSQSSSSSSSKSSSNATVNAQINTTIQTHLQTFFKTVQEQCSQQNIQEVKEQAEKQFLTAHKLTVAYLKEQKYNIPLVFLATSYGFIFYKLLYYSYHTVRSDTWSCWKDNLPFDMLRIIPEQELGKELVFAAQQKYQKPDILTDLLSPLIFFLRDVDCELQHLRKFIQLQQWLKKLRLYYLFPTQEKLTKIAQEKYTRLLYIKNVFIRWITDYKLALETKKNNEAA